MSQREQVFIEGVEADAWQTTQTKSQKSKANKANNNKNSFKCSKKIMSSEAAAVLNPINDLYNFQNIELVKSYISRSEKILVILRGLPGSGKSTLAEQIKFNGIVISADTYFMQNGIYVFDPSKLADAHMSCRTRVNNALKNKLSPIIVDNTNLKGYEFKYYATIGFQNNYKVELMEPNTPWKYKASMLAAKNVHGVPLNKIKRSLIDFEQNIDVKTLVGNVESSSQSAISKAKPGFFITNFNDYFAKNEWASDEKSTTELEQTEQNNNLIEFDTVSNSSQQSFNNNYNNNFIWPDDSLTNTITQMDPSENEESSKLIESKKILKAMFGNVSEEILMDFLVKYNNDLTLVTNILLDSLNLDEHLAETNNNSNNSDACEIDCEEFCEAMTLKETEPVSSLKDLCIKEMDNLEKLFEQHHVNVESDKPVSPTKSSKQPINIKPAYYNGPKPQFMEDNRSFKSFLSVEEPNRQINRPENKSQSCCTSPSSSSASSGRPATAKFNLSESSDFCVNENDGFNGRDSGDEPILKMNLPENVLSSLIQLFGEPADEVYLNNSTDVEVNFELAYQLYSAWKKTTTKTNTETNLDYTRLQIENDENLCIELFESINMRNPIEQGPHFFSEAGVNPAKISLRQIMAEEMAEQIKQNRFKKCQSTPMFPFNKIISVNNNSPANKNSQRQVPQQQQSAANTKYHDFNNNNNNSQKVDYYNCVNANEVCDANLSQNEYRYLANKYFNLRQDYFNKASEAYRRGWGAVAQYYAERAHEHGQSMHSSNEIASVQTFIEKNPNIHSSNVLDLHGLQVKEALNALKQIMFEKKQELNNSTGKKLKSKLFVITGFGHNSENGPRLRPNIINYLNQNGTKFKEPNVGILHIDLLD